jgi:ubiquinone/menaquinone biosynthesis C-methylase UbiE
LPGTDKQFEHLLAHNILAGEHALIMGSGCEPIATRLQSSFNYVEVIINNYGSLIQSRIELKEASNIKSRMMDFANTDFENLYFNLIYAQSSISVPERKDILKEIKRILNYDGIICIGEIVSLKQPVPAFVKDVWERSGLEPLPSSEIRKFYESRGFEMISESDLSYTLKDFYQKIRYRSTESAENILLENKKLYNAIKHESDVYLKHGGDKYIGFKSIIMRKKIEKG